MRATGHLRRRCLRHGDRRKAQRPELEARRRHQRPVGHRTVVQRRGVLDRRQVRVDHGGAPRVRRAAHRGPRRDLRSSAVPTTPPTASAAATRRGSATAAATATPSRWRRSTWTTSSPTSTSPRPRRRSAGRASPSSRSTPSGALELSGELHAPHLRHELAGVGRRQQEPHNTTSTRRRSSTTGVDARLPLGLRAFPGQEDRHLPGQGEVRRRRRQGRRPVLEGQGDQRDRQAHQRRQVPAVPGRRLPGQRQRLPGPHQLLLARKQHRCRRRRLHPGTGRDHRQRRDRVPVEAVRQHLGRRPRPQLLHAAGGRRLPAHQRPLRVAVVRVLPRQAAGRQHGVPGVRHSTSSPPGPTTRTW